MLDIYTTISHRFELKFAIIYHKVWPLLRVLVPMLSARPKIDSFPNKTTKIAIIQSIRINFLVAETPHTHQKRELFPQKITFDHHHPVGNLPMHPPTKHQRKLYFRLKSY